MIRIQLLIEHLLCAGFFILNFFTLLPFSHNKNYDICVTKAVSKVKKYSPVHMLIRIRIQAYLA